MRNIILLDEFHQTDFNPSPLLQEYLKKTQEDVETFFLKGKKLDTIACPACASEQRNTTFIRFNMTYVECQDCESLYILERPSDETLLDYYRYSSAEQFWRNELSKVTSAKRKSKIIYPRCQWVQDSVQEYMPHAQTIADLYTNQRGYLEPLSQLPTFSEKYLIHPFVETSEIETYPGFHIISESLNTAQLPKPLDTVLAFEVINRVSNVQAFLNKVHGLMNEGGLCFLTTILASGFDLQILGEKATNLFPPDWLNVFSVEGLKQLFETHGFEFIEFSTPGILDLEQIVNAVKHNPNLELPKFLKYWLNRRETPTKQAFQEFLQANLLSSYGRVLLRKV